MDARPNRRDQRERCQPQTRGNVHYVLCGTYLSSCIAVGLPLSASLTVSGLGLVLRTMIPATPMSNVQAVLGIVASLGHHAQHGG